MRTFPRISVPCLGEDMRVRVEQPRAAVPVDVLPTDAAFRRGVTGPAPSRSTEDRAGAFYMKPYLGLGAWTFDAGRLVLAHIDHPSYEIDCRQIKTSADLLDWVWHLRHKPWVCPEDIFDLLDLMDDLVNAREALADNKGVLPADAWDWLRGYA